ncbi:hypothetical protein [Streptomyces sp. SM12]|uniref:hypothetical protein n=1 Tax=Streptomyces sp. SM12 TaxID=1071602 RepID=UPI0011B05475|nr:hypothetical protein [Streptomyces sp. SM12]
MALPVPPERPVADTPVLIAQEQEMLGRCEVAIENLKVAFWAAGKALQVVRDGRLYRAEHGTFEEYVTERWGMSRGQADKLVRMWPVAQAMFESSGGDSNGLTRIRVKPLNQAVAWELVPVAERHDVPAATNVYRATAESSGEGRDVTAAVVRDVVREVVKETPKGEPVDPAKVTAAAEAAWSRAGQPRTPKPRKAPLATPALPWESPESLNKLLRREMSPENRQTLAKLLAD